MLRRDDSLEDMLSKHHRRLPREWGITVCRGFQSLSGEGPQKLSLVLKISQVSEQELGQRSNSSIGLSMTLRSHLAPTDSKNKAMQMNERYRKHT